jgi:gliding motility-associated-like protein
MKKIKYNFIVLVILLCNFKSFSQNLPPEIDVTGEQFYCPDALTPIVTDVTISDPNQDDTTLEQVFVQIAEGYVFGQDLLTLAGVNPNINSIWNQSEGLLKLVGPATFAEFENAIENIFFETTQAEFTQDRQFSINLGSANYLPSTGHYYFYVSDPGISWSQAREASSAQTYFGLQGYLATLATVEESQLAGEQSSGTGWIGGSDAEVEGTWKWVTGPENGDVFWQGTSNGTAPNGQYTFWNTNEPNNNGGEDYAHITSPNIGVLGSWNDLSVNGDPNSNSDYHPQGYIVEFGGLPNEPEINLSASSTIIMPRISSNDVTVCVPDTFTLTVDASTNDVFWYETSTSAVPIHSGLSYEVAISNTITYWLLPVVPDCLTNMTRYPLTVTTNEIPDVSDITIIQCEDDVMDGISNFNLSTYNDGIVNGSLNNINIQFFETIDLSTPIDGDNYINQVNNQLVYALVTNTTTNCSDIAELTLSVNTNSGNSVSLTVCDNLDETGLVSFDLGSADSQLLNGEPAEITALGYYETLSNALLQENELGSNYTNVEPYNQTIYARLVQNFGCYGIAEIYLNVERIPNLLEDETVYYCLNTFPETITLSGGIVDDIANNFYYNWSTGETTIGIEINEPGTYSVVVTKPLGCYNERTITVLPSNFATIESIDIADISDNNTITVLVSGEGDYVYALDNENGIYQESNSFENVAAGIHAVYVKDIKADCGVVSEAISVLGFPKFFTPNGDTKNDTWQISGFSLEFPVTAKVEVFNRYGKLITVLDQNNPSWDGTYNGEVLPMSDYWFFADLMDGRIYRGHFTLKR